MPAAWLVVPPIDLPWAAAAGGGGGAAATGRQYPAVVARQHAGMQSWIRDLIDLKTQISVLQNCMQQPASSHAAPASHYGCTYRVADNVNSGPRPRTTF
jgi:hypothetical protein